MTKEEFAVIEKKFREETAELRLKFAVDSKTYLEENRRFVDGQKVKVTTPAYNSLRWGNTPEKTEFAFVVCESVSGYNIVPHLKRCKADGTMGQHQFYLSLNNIVESI